MSYLQPVNSLADLYLIQNSKRFDPNILTEECIVKESIVVSTHLTFNNPQTIEAVITNAEVQDQVNFFQYGQSTFYNFWNLLYRPTRPSSSNEFPTNYKLVGIEFSVSPDLIYINRQNYNLLSFLGDIGGLDSTLEIIGAILIGGFSKSNAYSHLVSLLFM